MPSLGHWTLLSESPPQLAQQQDKKAGLPNEYEPSC
uniref:Uncharacterized protein n=1 Tax=Anguilla anguilla TaxID=7936 RepID=A0A0E9TZ32_ANGAN